MEDNNQAILIAGMHRSGTSLSTNLLRESGLFIGDDLMDGGFDNKNGHFEDNEFVNLHENDLISKGYESTGLKGVEKNNFQFGDVSKPIVEDLLKSRKLYNVWGWKDPRSTLYLLEWKKIIPDLKVIAIYRDYDEVINSLDRRYKYKIKHSVNYSKFRSLGHSILYPIYSKYLQYNHYKAWVIYNESILRFKELYPEDIVLYNLSDFINNYNNNIDTINSKFGVKLNHYNVDKVFESDTLINKKNVGFKFFNKKKLEEVMQKLNKEVSE